MMMKEKLDFRHDLKYDHEIKTSKTIPIINTSQNENSKKFKIGIFCLNEKYC
jgi:hypothetical protein